VKQRIAQASFSTSNQGLFQLLREKRRDSVRPKTSKAELALFVVDHNDSSQNSELAPDGMDVRKGDTYWSQCHVNKFIEPIRGEQQSFTGYRHPATDPNATAPGSHSFNDISSNPGHKG